MTHKTRLFVGLVIGFSVGVVLGQVGLYLLRELWPAYLAVDPSKSYTSAMLFTRLTIGALSAAAAGYITTVIAADNGKAAWSLGGLFLLLSLPIHLLYLWNAFPVWYHIIYLTYLVPSTGLAGLVSRKWRWGTTST